MPDGQPAPVTLIRAAARKAGAATYIVVHTGEVLGVLANLGEAFTEITDQPGDLDVNTVPWSILPGVRPFATVEMAGRPPRTAMLIGTTVDGRWTRWNPPCAPPPVPSLTGGN